MSVNVCPDDILWITEHWLTMMYYQIKFDCKQTSSLEDIKEIVIFWLYKPALWPWHWRQWTNLSAWHWLMTLYDHTKFGNKMFCGLEDSIRTIFTDNVNLRCDLDLERSNPIFFRRTLWLIMLYYQTRVWLQADQQFGRCSRNSHILIILALAVTLTLTTVNQFFSAWQFASW